MRAPESNRALWVATFSLSAAVLAAGLIYLVAFAPLYGYRSGAYVVCAVAGGVCLWAAWGVRDSSRASAAADGLWLAAQNLPEVDD